MFWKIKNILDGKNILILGFGREGKSTLNFIKKHIDYKSVTVADKNIVDISDYDDVDGLFGEHYMTTLDTYDIIIKSPGIAYANQSESVIKKTTSQTDLFLLEYAKNTIGITGTKGKSTTTTLIYHVLSTASKDAVLLGNIGIPPLDVAESMNEDTIAVFEMSCHQLEFAKISPRVAVLLNLFEDHLDHYGTREKYVKAKENIFLHQNSEDCCVINCDCCEQIKKINSCIIKIGFEDSCDYKVSNRNINGVFTIPDNISLIGEHNEFNITVAYATTKIFGVTDEDFERALITYKSLPHRLEFVANKHGVDYYDDSISTIPQTTIQAIKSLKNVKTVILGGMDRGIDYRELVDYLTLNPVENIILLPGAGQRMALMLEKQNVKFVIAQNLADAVTKAGQLTSSGGKCVLSPAAASYGYYKNFEERGEHFKKLVNAL